MSLQFYYHACLILLVSCSIVFSEIMLCVIYRICFSIMHDNMAYFSFHRFVIITNTKVQQFTSVSIFYTSDMKPALKYCIVLCLMIVSHFSESVVVFLLFFYNLSKISLRIVIFSFFKKIFFPFFNLICNHQG